MYYFPKASDGVVRDDPVGSEHHDKAGALKEGSTYIREMAMERLKGGDDNFEESVEIRDAEGTLLGRKLITVKSSGSE
ncbi:MAG: hypothetical protein H0U98_14325 [Alphaproteobacteria bacterium]|nr:hypothetical protein [Alphaproteobacteria bacterium]